MTCEREHEIQLFVKINHVGLSHNTERGGGGELLLSFSSKNNKTHNDSNKLRNTFYHGNFKEKTTNSNPLIR